VRELKNCGERESASLLLGRRARTHTHTTARTQPGAYIHNTREFIKACAWESQQSVSQRGALLFTPIKAEAWITRITTATLLLLVGKEDEKNSHHAATQGCSHQRTLAPSTLSLKGYAAARFELNFIRRRKSFHMPFFTVRLFSANVCNWHLTSSSYIGWFYHPVCGNLGRQNFKTKRFANRADQGKLNLYDPVYDSTAPRRVTTAISKAHFKYHAQSSREGRSEKILSRLLFIFVALRCIKIVVLFEICSIFPTAKRRRVFHSQNTNGRFLICWKSASMVAHTYFFVN
jgi:hypothetical protein